MDELDKMLLRDARRDERIRAGQYVWNSEAERLNERASLLEVRGTVVWENLPDEATNRQRGFWLVDNDKYLIHLGTTGEEADSWLDRLVDAREQILRLFGPLDEAGIRRVLMLLRLQQDGKVPRDFENSCFIFADEATRKLVENA